MLFNLKLLLGITDSSKDDLLNLIIAQVEADTKAITHSEYVSECEYVMLAMCVYRYNLIGTEGLTHESYNGGSYTYAVDYPDYIRRQLLAYRHIRVVSEDD